MRRAYNTKQRKEDNDKEIWLKKVNEQKQKPPEIKLLPDARMHPEPNPQPSHRIRNQ